MLLFSQFLVIEFWVDLAFDLRVVMIIFGLSIRDHTLQVCIAAPWTAPYFLLMIIVHERVAQRFLET